MNDGRTGLGHGPGAHGNHGSQPLHPTAPPMNSKPPALVDESIELVEELDATPAPSKIRQLGPMTSHADQKWKRTTHSNQTGAARVRSFHGRLSEQGLEYLDNAINDWLDHHPDVEVKFVTSTVGQFDGKIKEPALILNVWY
jgi:hypothetical protein